MNRLGHIFAILCLISCNKPDKVADNTTQAVDSITLLVDTTSQTSQSSATKLTIIVLPPYDEIANAGISPNIQKYLEREISSDTTVTLIEFPYRDLMDVPYHNVFDKKYCKPVVDKVDVDIVIMSKLELDEQMGQVAADKWTFSIRIYNVKEGVQVDSRIGGKDLSDNMMLKRIKEQRNDLIEEIKNCRRQSL